MLASAKTTRDPALSPVRAGWFAFPLAPALRSTDSAAVTESGCALFAGFPATMTGLDFPRPYIIGYSSSLSRHGPPASSAGGQTWDLPSTVTCILMHPEACQYIGNPLTSHVKSVCCGMTRRRGVDAKIARR